jgi:hypothetical protein
METIDAAPRSLVRTSPGFGIEMDAKSGTKERKTHQVTTR